ncbi:MAG: hypothetical protein HKP37_08480 [Boseongicola sp.]|nr:hypothetical protein [Boseongicola sp.]
MNKITSSLAALALLMPAYAVADDVPDVLAQVEVMPGWRGDDGLHRAALAITLAPGWKTYWRTPGDAGIPPIFDWSGSENLSGAGVSFPVPYVFYENGMRSIGYDDGMILPITLRANDDGSDIELEGRMTIGVCLDICVPVELDFAALLPGAETTPSKAISRAMTDRPMTSSEAGVEYVRCDIEPIRDGMRITAMIDVPPMSEKDVAVIELPDRSIWVSEAKMTRRGNTLVASADMVPPDAQPFILSRQDVRITVIGGGQAIDIRGCD